MKKKRQNVKEYKPIAGTVKYRNYMPICIFAGGAAAVIFGTMAVFLCIEGTYLLSMQGFWMWFAVMLVFLLIFWKYFQYAILFSENQKAFIVNTMLTHRTYFSDDIASIHRLEIRCKLPTHSGYNIDGTRDTPSLGKHSPFALWTAGDVQFNFLILRIGKRKLRVNLNNEKAEQFCWFLHRTTAKEIWQETKYKRIWTIDDLFVSSKDDPWETARKEQKKGLK